MTLLIAFTFFLSVLFLSIGIRIEIERASPLARLRQRGLGPRELSPEEAELRRPFTARFLGPVAQRVLRWIARTSPQAMRDGIRKRLQAAGNPLHAHSEEVILMKIVLAASGAGIAFAGLGRLLDEGSQLRLIGAFFGGAVGFILPDIWIDRAIKARRRQISRSLPYVLDLLCVSVEAGLAFDGAMQKVAEKVEGPLSEEFRQVAYEVRIGKLRRDALRDMRDRCRVEDLNTFIAAVIQAERLGLGIGQVLRVQSEQLRNVRRERAREQAMKIPIKMLFPLIFLILPALFIVVLGPAVIQVLNSVVGGGP